MKEYLKKDFAKILKRNALEAHRMMKNTSSTACRVYDRNIEELPVTVELYGKYARIVDFSDVENEDKDEIMDIASRYLYIEKSNVIYRSCKKREGREQHEKAEESLKTVVTESGHEFEVELKKYTDTGLFLDHAETRRLVESISENLDVLNLFSYTGSFSVYAASGGAKSVESVDLSNVYSAWAEENMRRNGFLDEKKYAFLREDAWTFLKRSFEEGKKWDLVIFDPPAFSNSNKAEDFDIKKDYLKYLLIINALLRDDGIVIFSENLSNMNVELKKLRRFYKTRELTAEVKALGFSRRSAMRCFLLEKIYDSKEFIMKRIDDDQSLERLTLDEKGPKREKKERRPWKEDGERRFEERPRREERYFSERRWDERPRREGHSRFEERGYSGRQRSYDDDYRPRGERRGSRRDDYRPRYEDDYRPRRRDDDWRDRRPGYEEERRMYDGYGHRGDDLPDYRKRRSFDDRPRYSDERPRFRDERPKRREDRYDRPRDDNRLKPYEGSGNMDKKSFGEAKTRRRNPPVPYGMDSFHSSKKKKED